jgi:hypothetical protein
MSVRTYVHMSACLSVCMPRFSIFFRQRDLTNGEALDEILRNYCKCLNSLYFHEFFIVINCKNREKEDRIRREERFVIIVPEIELNGRMNIHDISLIIMLIKRH